MSTSPFVPNPSDGFPVAASNDSSFVPAVTMIRSGVFRSPGKYPTPRRERPPPGPPGTSRCQITLPVSASSATTELPTGRYITPATTIGTASDPPPRPPPRPPPGGGGGLYDQAFCSCATLAVLISVSGENRVPARSWLYVCHSWAGVAAFFWASAIAAYTDSPRTIAINDFFMM